jgi:hypothetical protein
VYHGEFRKGSFDGYGQIIYANKDEYDGRWRRGKKYGIGFFKEASTGKVFRMLNGKRKLYVFEEIEKGQ